MTVLSTQKNYIYQKLVGDLTIRNITYYFADLSLIRLISGICDSQCPDHGPTQLYIWLSGVELISAKRAKNYISDRRANSRSDFSALTVMTGVLTPRENEIDITPPSPVYGHNSSSMGRRQGVCVFWGGAPLQDSSTTYLIHLWYVK